jgi:hypothetical protein
MNDDPEIAPIPTLNYYSEEQSPALRLLVRLVLLAGALNALLNAISFIGGNFPPWSPPSQLVDFAILIGQVPAWLTVAISCFVFLKSRRGRAVIISAQSAALMLDTCYYFRQILQYPQLGNIAVMLAAIASDCLLPSLLVVILLRRDMRPPEQLNR